MVLLVDIFVFTLVSEKTLVNGSLTDLFESACGFVGTVAVSVAAFFLHELVVTRLCVWWYDT